MWGMQVGDKQHVGTIDTNTYPHRSSPIRIVEIPNLISTSMHAQPANEDRDSYPAHPFAHTESTDAGCWMRRGDLASLAITSADCTRRISGLVS